MDHTKELLLEYCRRYDKMHKCVDVYAWCLKNMNNIPFKSQAFTTPLLAMPDEYKNPDPVIAYRNYYKLGKKHLHSWKMNKPDWID